MSPIHPHNGWYLRSESRADWLGQGIRRVCSLPPLWVWLMIMYADFIINMTPHVYQHARSLCTCYCISLTVSSLLGQSRHTGHFQWSATVAWFDLQSRAENIQTHRWNATSLSALNSPRSHLSTISRMRSTCYVHDHCCLFHEIHSQT
jgi:hypothetical protein